MSDTRTSQAPGTHGARAHQPGGLGRLALGAIGIVFGDIGTSPIYAFRETFAGHHPLAHGQTEVTGVLSLIFWSMVIVVSVKYVGIITRADNKGEGGSLALLALVNRSSERAQPRWTAGIVLLGVFACSLFYGDSMITPAISVLSAVEGLTTVQSGFAPFVLPVAAGILIGLFAIQSHGTARVGALFGPVMMLYLFTIALLGAVHVASYPWILVETINP